MTKHSQEEIDAKLSQASGLAAQGKSQADIAKALGISVMTYHRWRKGRRSSPHALHVVEIPSSLPAAAASEQEIGDLLLENTRLRRVVTDLLLEKVRLEELLGKPARKGYSR
jgi:putative transposase